MPGVDLRFEFSGEIHTIEKKEIDQQEKGE